MSYRNLLLVFRLLCYRFSWEVDDSYCSRVVNTKLYSKGVRLLDLIDIAIFDFLIGNADRHLYEVLDGFEDSIPLMMDNGKRQVVVYEV